MDSDYLAINSTNSNFQLNFGNLKNLNTYLGSFNEVIFSGILNSQKDEIIKILIQNDLKLLDVSTRKDWACISAQKASNPT